MAKNKNKKHKSPNVNIGKGLAKVGKIGTSFGVIMGWISVVVFSIIGLIMIYMAIKGVSTDSTCEPIDNTNFNNDCFTAANKNQCDLKGGCRYKTSSGNMDGNTRTLLVVGGVVTILIGVGILMLTKYAAKMAAKDKNVAAVAGGFMLADAIFGRR